MFPHSKMGRKTCHKIFTRTAALFQHSSEASKALISRTTCTRDRTVTTAFYFKSNTSPIPEKEKQPNFHKPRRDSN